MKVKGYSLVFLALVVVASGCVSNSTQPSTDNTNSNTNSPQVSSDQVVRNYITALTNGNIDEAYTYLSSDLRADSRTDRLEQKSLLRRHYQTQGSDWDPRVHSIEELSSNNGTATVNVQIDLYVMNNYAETLNANVTTVQEENEWKLQEALNPYSPDGNNIIAAGSDSGSNTGTATVE